ncbi:hypothetical protein B0H16DRAFT_1736043 [Mycena metata]|uniref:Uncharacterized protein n=1 Tax=Mycena metata TaxID=1033252 RepID=A0AAD7HRE8_9AGAR|nr:hypothetical protein B0H16DRAFT_1743349 [Mycena metata]KAJ7725733.1 hypothetical protein B0H16DRAFT_1736043 [Mycena metata]
MVPGRYLDMRIRCGAGGSFLWSLATIDTVLVLLLLSDDPPAAHTCSALQVYLIRVTAHPAPAPPVDAFTRYGHDLDKYRVPPSRSSSRPWVVDDEFSSREPPFHSIRIIIMIYPGNNLGI